MGLKGFISNFSIAALISLSGCKSSDSSLERDVGLYAMPANVALGYFGSVGIHEGSHALAAEAIGADSIKVNVLPRYSAGNLTFGDTQFKYAEISDIEESLFNIAGPASMFVSQVTLRELLRNEIVPIALQPTLQWLAVCNKVSFYVHAIRGIARDKNSDLGKEDLWVSLSFLLGGMSYDVYDLLTDSPSRYVGVLAGQEFYGEEERKIRPGFYSDGKSSYFGLSIDW